MKMGEENFGYYVCLSLFSGKHFKKPGDNYCIAPVISTFKLPHKKERHG